MKNNQPKEVRLAEYEIPSYLIDTTHLHFELGETATLVKSNLQIRRNPKCQVEGRVPLVLQGVDLELNQLTLDGHKLTQSDFQVDAETLVIPQVPRNFELECVTLIRPDQNTSLAGLYKSNALFCTQCEAEGFRKITYYLDRPDVMSVFTTTIVAEKGKYPVLLSNGNDIDRGTLNGGRHWVTWHDPFKKPAYLFALVAGDLQSIDDEFITCSKRKVQLQIFVEPENIDKCAFAMDSLKRAMSWDEKVYGREYDLDKFMIVAVNDFNAGAMENKGLNIFNSSCVLTKPETATDSAFQRVEAVVAHEYFHNWSGNRVTCRDWFQLSLKEGFTVFRDQEFSADMGSSVVKRIDDVSLLRTVQFAEDAGPMAHPVRPDSYLEISNFYTVTIYEKGAELVRMMYHMLGEQAFRKGTDLYFKRHDGQAVTTDDFVSALEDASGVDLQQFRQWYRQPGTPLLTVSDSYDPQEQVYRMTVKQTCSASVVKVDYQPLHIPFSMALLNENGDEQEVASLDITELEQTFVFDKITSKPIPSLLRGFSAPVKLAYPYSRDDLMFLMSHDSDGFNRWDAGQKLAIDIMREMIQNHQQGDVLRVDQRLIVAFRKVLLDKSLDQAMVARMLVLPSEAYLSELSEQVDPHAIHQTRQFVRTELAQQLKQELLDCYLKNQNEVPYVPRAEDIAQRSLKNVCLHYLMLLKEPDLLAHCQKQFSDSNNMTDTNAALTALVHAGYISEGRQALDNFYQQWRKDPLVIDQWFSIQASSPADGTFEHVKGLLQHEAFSMRNPNKVRSLVGVFCNQNATGFHRHDGAGYAFLADRVLELDLINPSIAARLLIPLTKWRHYIPTLSVLMKKELERVRAKEALSKDVFEIASKSL
ncbi:MAG: aminopeptidase N [Pseudomonadales bacterium]|nr:aminopeptidase N [Pseudomonadales bacterium]